VITDAQAALGEAARAGPFEGLGAFDAGGEKWHSREVKARKEAEGKNPRAREEGWAAGGVSGPAGNAFAPSAAKGRPIREGRPALSKTAPSAGRP